jgi:hypothetical protein
MADTKSADRARRKHLEVLLEKLTSHADVLRHHLTHNPTLGVAAEAGVRDVLRMVLPRRLAVTSGFIRSQGGNLIIQTDRKNISAQTDIVIYDALHACPLYSFEGVEVLAAPDVLGVIEVKDSTGKENDLGPSPPKANPKKAADRSNSAGALDHIAELAQAAPQAFRGIVLIQGGNAPSARAKMEYRQLTDREVPHVVYCRTIKNTKTHSRKNYVAFYEYLTNQVHFHVYGPGRKGATSALAGFLRVVTGFFAAQGLMTGAIPSDLRPEAPTTTDVPPLELGPRRTIESLRDHLLETYPYDPATESPPYEKMLRQFFADKKAKRLRIRARDTVVGRDREGQPTAGALLSVRWDENGSRQYASFFKMIPAGVFACADPDETKPAWVVPREPLDAYLKRVCSLDASFFDDKPEGPPAPDERGVDAPPDARYA